MLNGIWQGTLGENYSVLDVSVSPERVFELRDLDSPQVLVRRLSDGAVLTERSVPSGLRFLVWRADGALLVGGEQAWQRLDPETLAPQEEHPLPARLLGFSADGTVAQLEGGVRLDTRTGQALAPAESVSRYLQTSDDGWRRDDAARTATRLSDGLTMDLASKHGNPCH